MNFRFVKVAEDLWNGRHRKRDSDEPSIDLTTTERDDDDTIVGRLRSIVNDETLSAARRLQNSSILLSNAKSSNNILMEIGPQNVMPKEEMSVEKKQSRTRGIKAGAPALLLTGDYYLRMIEEINRKKMEEEATKVEKRKVREKNRLEKAAKRASKNSVVGGSSKRPKSE